MNNNRRKQISALLAQLNEIRDSVEQLQGEEQEGFDNLPEGLQQSEKGHSMEQAAEQLGSALESVDEALQALEEAQA